MKYNTLIHNIGCPDNIPTKLFLFAVSRIRMMDETAVADPHLYDRIRRERGIDFSKGLVAAFSASEFTQYLYVHNGSYLSNVPSPKDIIHNCVVTLPSSDGTYLAGSISVITATYYDEKSDMIFIKFNEEDVIIRELYVLKESYSIL